MNDPKTDAHGRKYFEKLSDFNDKFKAATWLDLFDENKQYNKPNVPLIFHDQYANIYRATYTPPNIDGNLVEILVFFDIFLMR